MYISNIRLCVPCLTRLWGKDAHMGWPQLVGSLKWWVSFAKEPYKRDYILQKRRIILRSLLIVATPYHIGRLFLNRSFLCVNRSLLRVNRSNAWYHMHDMTYPHATHSHVWHDLFTRVIWDMTQSNVWHDSLTYPHATHSHVVHVISRIRSMISRIRSSHDAMIWRNRMCDMTHSRIHMRRIHMCDMTCSHVWYDSPIWCHDSLVR